eukprot:gene16703-16882_t
MLARDENTLIFGEDVGYFGGVFRVTDGLQKKYGLKRCFDTPISEGGIVATAIGMGAYGLRPVVEIQFADYIFPAIDQLISEAARLRYRSNGEFSAPITVRSPYGGGIFGGQTHSQSPEAIFAHVTGLKTIIPSNPYDAKGLLISAIEDDDPVIFLEPKRLYNGPFEGRQNQTAKTWAGEPMGEVPDGYYKVPLGKAAIAREGTAVTVLAYGTMVHVALIKMGRFLFRLPDIGEGVAEAEIVARAVKIGDHVREDQSLLDVMTDKATVEMTSPVAGIVVALHGDIGDMMPVGGVLVEFEVEGAGNSDAAPATPKTAEPVALSPAPEHAEKPVLALSPSQSTPQFISPLASPFTRHRAYELAIDLNLVKGSGPAGRILPADLEAHSQRQSASAAAGLSKNTTVHDTRIIGLRRKIAEKMQEAKRRIPHFSYIEECDVTELEALRQELNQNLQANQPKLTLLPFFMRALVKVLPHYPNINARYDDDAGVLYSFEGVHIGIATQTANGLIVPVVHHAEALTIWDCARELTRVTSAARNGTAPREALTGSTITLSSLGALGGVAATPVINHPEVAIIGPNKIIERPMVHNGQITIRKMMNISSSFDHRIVDGHDAARFIQQLKRIQAVGAHISEFSGEFATLLEMGAVLEDVRGIIHAHPTQGEAIFEASLKALGHAIHI